MTEMKDKETKQTPGFSEHQDDWQIVRNGINFFRKYFAKEYMVLLDWWVSFGISGPPQSGPDST